MGSVMNAPARTDTVYSLSSRFPMVLTLAFLAIAGFGIYNHEMWRDELEIFMEMRDTPNFLSLFPNVQPLPNLYLSVLYPIVKLWPNPIIFQIFHLLVITLAVFIFNRYSPFNRLQKIFFTFSYFVLFEYGIISREYSLLLLFVFFLVYLITREKQNFIFIAVAMVILANHHLYGVFASISIFIYEVFYLAPKVKELAPQEKRNLRIAGLLLAVFSLYIVSQYFLLLKFNRYVATYGQAPYFMTIRSIWNAFLPIPSTTGINFWGTNILPFPQMYSKTVVGAKFLSAGNILAVVVSLLIVLINIIIVSRRIPVLIAFLINTAMQLIFLQYLSVFYIRYQGPLVIIFIYNYWLLSHADGKSDWRAFHRMSDFFTKPFFVSYRRFASSFVTFVLFIQFCVGIFCYTQDIRYPFTSSYETAKYIKEQGLNNSIMVGYIDYAVQTISGHLNQKIFYPQKGDLGTHVVWLDKKRRDTMPLHEVLDSAITIRSQTGRNVLLILNTPLLNRAGRPVAHIPLYDGSSLIFLKGFAESIVPDERFFLYLIALERA
jgi:hypothetical protein